MLKLCHAHAHNNDEDDGENHYSGHRHCATTTLSILTASDLDNGQTTAIHLLVRLLRQAHLKMDQKVTNALCALVLWYALYICIGLDWFGCDGVSPGVTLCLNHSLMNSNNLSPIHVLALLHEIKKASR